MLKLKRGALPAPQPIDLSDYDSEDIPRMDSGMCCDFCGEPLYIAEEVVMLFMKEACWDEGKVFTQTLPEQDTHQPMPAYYTHMGCWEDKETELHETVQDVPPLALKDQVYPCSICGGSIGQCIPFAAVVVVEVHRAKNAKRRDEGPLDLEEISKHIPVCLLCVARLTSTCLEAWEDGVLELLQRFDDHYESAMLGV